MTRSKALNIAVLAITAGFLAACSGGLGSSPATSDDAERFKAVRGADSDPRSREDTIWSLFDNNKGGESTVAVNRYLWGASLEVLNFLPIQSVDPFTGVIVTGFGTPPGGGTSYRATVLIDDPALDARSLNVALQSRGGPVSAATSRAVEDAILSRAREMRIADNKF